MLPRLARLVRHTIEAFLRVEPPNLWVDEQRRYDAYSRRNKPTTRTGHRRDDLPRCHPDAEGLGDRYPAKHRGLPDGVPTWFGEAYDLDGVDAMLAELRADREGGTS